MWVELCINVSEVLTLVLKMAQIMHYVRFGCQSEVQVTHVTRVRCMLEAVIPYDSEPMGL